MAPSMWGNGDGGRHPHPTPKRLEEGTNHVAASATTQPLSITTTPTSMMFLFAGCLFPV